jgi:hypothetical protein
MRPETTFLIDICARQRGLEPALRVERGPDFDWGFFLDAADRHKVTGLAYSAFSSGRSDPPPPSVLARLKRAAAEKAAAKALLLSEWRALDAALAREGFRALVIKGPALALQLFGDAFAREYRDIDLLVESEAREAVSRVFEGLGYAAKDVTTAASSRQSDYLQKRSRHVAYVKRGSPAFFEVHFSKEGGIGLAPIPTSAAFARAEALSGPGLRIMSLGKSDHVLLALLHGAEHAWCQLQWVLDAMAAIGDLPDAAEVPDWDGIDASLAIDSFALMARSLFAEGSIGPRLSEAIPGRRAIALSRFALTSLASAGARLVAFSSDMFRYRLAYLSGLRRGTRAKARFLIDLVLPSETDASALGGRNIPLGLLFLLRPLLAARRILQGQGAAHSGDLP